MREHVRDEVDEFWNLNRDHEGILPAVALGGRRSSGVIQSPVAEFANGCTGLLAKNRLPVHGWRRGLPPQFTALCNSSLAACSFAFRLSPAPHRGSSGRGMIVSQQETTGSKVMPHFT